MAKGSKTPRKGGLGDWTLRTMAALVKELGIAGFSIVFLASFLTFYATPDQKKRFIDIWILMEGRSHVPCILTIIFLTSISLIGGIYFKTMLKMVKDENIRIGQEKSDLQEKLLQSKLSSSKRTPKQSQ